MIKKILKILHLNTLVYKSLKYVSFHKLEYKKAIREYSLHEVEQSMNLLNKFHPDVKNSSFTKNQIEPLYNLQIIVPVYNVEKYILDCIDSILRQETKYSYLITIINDGSPDNSRNLLNKYEGITNVEIIDQENKGFSGARNRGLKNIKAQFIAFVDSDDRFHQNNAIEVLLDAAYEHNADIVQGGYASISATGKTRRVYKMKFSCTQNDTNGLLGFPWGKVFKAELFKNHHFPEKYWFEDTLCSYILFNIAQRCVTIPNIVYDYRVNLNGITYKSAGKPKVLDTLYVTGTLLKDSLKYKYFETERFYIRQLRQFSINCIRLSRLNNFEIEHAAFLIQCHWLEKYFSKIRLSKQKKYPLFLYEIEEAMRTHNFKQYKYASLLLR